MANLPNQRNRISESSRERRDFVEVSKYISHIVLGIYLQFLMRSYLKLMSQ